MATALLRRCWRAPSFFLCSEKPAVLRPTIHTSVRWDFNSCEVPEGGDPSSIPGNRTDDLAKPNYGDPVTLSEKPGVTRPFILSGVWWDISDCKVPKGCDPSSIAGNITEALARLNYGAPATFSAYGNTYLIPLSVQYALFDSGVTLIHCPHGQSDNKYSSSHYMHGDMVAWVFRHPEPANCLIISGDSTFRNLPLKFSLFRPNGVNFLFASPRINAGVEIQMKSISKAFWRWSSLRAGGPPQWARHRKLRV